MTFTGDGRRRLCRVVTHVNCLLIVHSCRFLFVCESIRSVMLLYISLSIVMYLGIRNAVVRFYLLDINEMLRPYSLNHIILCLV